MDFIIQRFPIYDKDIMQRSIKDLKMENDDYTIIKSPNKDWLMNLSKVNIFVGANNTGKSISQRATTCHRLQQRACTTRNYHYPCRYHQDKR